MIHWTPFDLSVARVNPVQVAGAAHIVVAFTENASVIPQLQYTMRGKPETVDVSPTIKIKTPMDSISVLNPAGIGTLLIGVGDDPCDDIDGPSGAGGAGVTLRRELEAWYLPHGVGAVGAAPNLNWVGGLGASASLTWSNEIAGTGLNPIINWRGHRCVQCRPNGAGGSSGLQLSYSIPWRRTLTEIRSLRSRTHQRLASHRIDFLLSRDILATPNPDGTGLQFMPGQGNKRSLDQGVAGFGIVSDGVSWWGFRSRPADGGGYAITVALPVPPGVVNANDFVRFGLEVADADPKTPRDGVVNVYVDDLIAFSFTDMTAFPPSGDTVTRTGLDVHLADSGTAAGLGDLCVSHGNFRIDLQLAGTP